MLARYRRVIWVCLGLLTLAAGLVFAANYWVIRQTRDRIITDTSALPANDVALVLRTSRHVGGRWANPFFEGRMNSAARLYHEGKVRHLLVSGDNGRVGYDEPTWMRDALVERGVPVSAITLDFAGFRTWDSMIRAQAVFGLKRFTIVTDDFHQPRSVFLARSLGLDVVGCPSEHVPFRWSQRTRARELVSRAVACLDVYVLHTKPRFYGPPVEIHVAAAQ
jgi:SanA protein